jgi:NADH:quinone reductase (non-electrogenic)
MDNPLVSRVSGQKSQLDQAENHEDGCASIPDRKTGGFHPPTAQHAIREARCAARNVAADIVGGKRKAFRFSTLGRLAAIGRRSGVANVFGLNFSGFLARWLWRTITCSSSRGSKRR